MKKHHLLSPMMSVLHRWSGNGYRTDIVNIAFDQNLAVIDITYYDMRKMELEGFTFGLSYSLTKNRWDGVLYTNENGVLKVAPHRGENKHNDLFKNLIKNLSTLSELRFNDVNAVIKMVML